MKNANDFYRVSYSVKNHMGPLGVLSIAQADFVAWATDQRVLANELKRIIKLSEIVVSLCFAPFMLSKSTNSQ